MEIEQPTTNLSPHALAEALQKRNGSLAKDAELLARYCTEATHALERSKCTRTLGLIAVTSLGGTRQCAEIAPVRGRLDIRYLRGHNDPCEVILDKIDGATDGRPMLAGPTDASAFRWPPAIPFALDEVSRHEPMCVEYQSFDCSPTAAVLVMTAYGRDPRLPEEPEVLELDARQLLDVIDALTGVSTEGPPADRLAAALAGLRRPDTAGPRADATSPWTVCSDPELVARTARHRPLQARQAPARERMLANFGDPVRQPTGSELWVFEVHAGLVALERTPDACWWLCTDVRMSPDMFVEAGEVLAYVRAVAGGQP